MTQNEKAELREYIVEYLKNWSKRFPNPIIEDHAELDEDSSQFYTSKAELEVFGLKPQDLHKLHAAHSLYEIFIDIIHGHGLDKEFTSLIVKAREICPPVHYFGEEFEFRTGCDVQQWFSWFAQEFFDLPLRPTHAFWHKRSFNTSHLLKFKDEITLDRFSKSEIENLWNKAPDIGPELIPEFYTALDKGGVEAVNNLFARKGTFNPAFKNKQSVIEFIVVMKQFSGMELTPEEQAIANLDRFKN